MTYFLSVLGMFLVVESIPWFLSPGTIKKAILQIVEVPDRILRISGFFLMMVGLLVVRLAVS